MRWPWSREGGPRALRGEGPGEALARCLIGDCEAFLLGHLAERWAKQGLGVPVWAWTNLLAHATGDELEDAAAQIHRDPWGRARGFLAGDVLDLAATYGPLGRIQQAVLVPVELVLSSRRDVEDWEPNQLVQCVEAALNAYRHDSRRAVW